MRHKILIGSIIIVLINLFMTNHLYGYVDLPKDKDATPALDQAALLTCASKDTRVLQLPAGIYYFSTQPKPFNCAISLIGQGKGATRLIRNYSGGHFLEWRRGTDQSGGSIKDLNIEAGPGTHHGVAIYVKATPDTDGKENSYNRHSFLIDNILVGRTDLNASWDYGLYLDGSDNPDGNKNSIPGIRGVFVSRSSIGGTNRASIYLNKARGTDLQVECYTPLNNSFAGVVLDNMTDSVKLDSRNCQWVSWDNTGTDLIFNGKRYDKNEMISKNPIHN